MKALLVGFIFLLLAEAGLAQNPIPKVPSTVEIAHVKLKLTPEARAEIQKDVNALRASPKYFQIKLDRVNLYFPIIERVLKEEGVPDDLKYLSVQESALISDAVSSANAVGYWQFKDFTAKEVGLRVDGKIDERKNIVSATRGAAKYFKRNNFYFKNWIYSVSAYQAGPGGAKKYVDKANFGSDKLTITDKTHWYVLRYIAHVIAFRDEVGGPTSTGLNLVEYTKGENKTLNEIARQFDIEEDLVKDYNKWLKHGRIPSDRTYHVIIPVQGKLPKSLQDEETKPLARSIENPVEIKYPDRITGDFHQKDKTLFIKINGIEAVMASKEDNIVKLALKAGISSDQLIKYNDLQPNQRIQSGEIYYTRKKKWRSPVPFHIAQWDESLWEISQKYGVRLDKLLKKNRMSPDEEVKPGRIIWLKKKRPKNTPVEYHKISKPVPVPPKEVLKNPLILADNDQVEELQIKQGQAENEITENSADPPMQETQPEPSREDAPPTGDRIHIVEAGETLWSIAQRYEVNIESLMEWNELTAQSILTTGQSLEVKSATQEEKSLQEEEPTKIHEVRPGESLWGISRQYDVTVEDLRVWNGLTEEDPISPGQSLLLQAPEPVKDADKELIIYVVRGGDSLYKIAHEYGITVTELMEMNDLETTSLSVGDELKIIRKN